MTRDIRLTDIEIVELRDLCRRRARELDKRLEKTSYAGKPGMKENVVVERQRLRALAATFEHAREQIARQFAERHLPQSISTLPPGHVRPYPDRERFG